VDLGGVEGQILAQDVACFRGGICFPAVGTKGRFWLLSIDPEGRQIALSEPVHNWECWLGAAEQYPVGSRHVGEVVALMSYGVFVKLEPGLEGLLHLSEIQKRVAVRHPKEHFA